MIFLTGDTHGLLEIEKLNSHNFPAGDTLTRDDFVVILGDFGLLWHNPPRRDERFALQSLEDAKWTTLFVDGNHENFAMLSSLPEEERFGAPVGLVSPHVLHLRRGYIYNIEGRRCFVFGGARSVDRKFRTKDRSWWSEEIPSEAEFRRGLDSLEMCGWEVDWILSHTAPNHILQALDMHKYMAGDPVSAYFDEIQREVLYNKWFCGHLHRNIFFPKDRIHVLRENIINGETGEIVSVERNRPPMRERIRALKNLCSLEGD